MSFKIGQVEVGLDKPFFLIAGPCVIESENICLGIAKHLVRISEKTGVPVIFKASFDKANRSSIDSYRGPGLYRGLNILKAIRKATDLPILTDVHEAYQAEVAARFVDCLQIPAFLCRQTDLLVACAKTGLPINVKKGQFMAPVQMKMVVDKIVATGKETADGKREHKEIMLTERGSCFGYNMLINDMVAIASMKSLGYPVVFDATHSIQRPGLMCGGNNMEAVHLARAAVAAGANGLFLEVHPNPSESKSDYSTIMQIDWVEDLLIKCKKIYEIVRL